MAIKVNGTTVINDSRQLTNIASVDAATVTALGNAGVGGAPTYLPEIPNFNSPTTTFTSNGTYSRGSTSANQLIWIYMVGGGQAGYSGNSGAGGSYRFIICTAGTLDGSSYTIGQGGTAGSSTGHTPSTITIGGTTYSTNDGTKYSVIDGALPTRSESTYIINVVYSASITDQDNGQNYQPYTGYYVQQKIFSAGGGVYVYSDGSAGNGGFGYGSVYAGIGGRSTVTHSSYAGLPTYYASPTAGTYPGGGGGSSYGGSYGTANGANGNIRIYHIS